MGNKASYVDTRPAQAQYCSIYGAGLQSLASEESYIPMTLTMKRTLVKGRRFRHVTPAKEVVRKRVEREEKEEKREVCVDGVLSADASLNEDVMQTSLSENSKNSIEQKESGESEEISESFVNVEPVVTVLNFSGIKKNSTNDMSPQICKRNISVDNQTECIKSSQKSPSLINRRYSLIDMRTGLKKSKFTLELEDKLRQSKLELGFDDDLHDWKEYSYKMENRVRAESLQKGSLKFPLEGNVGQGLEKVLLKEPLQYCAHNCQILGLCSVRSPEVKVFKDDISQKYKEVQSILKGEVEHHKKDKCNCDHCMLAYLTEMAFTEEEGSLRCESARKASATNSYRGSRKWSGRSQNERLRLFENGNTGRSIEVCVSDRPSAAKSDNNLFGKEHSQSNLSTKTSFDADITNRKIKRMFQKNGALIKEIYNNRKEIQDKHSIVNHSSTENTRGCFDDISREVVQVQSMESGRLSSPRRFRGSNGKRSSSSTLGASASSSLSSVLSYRRVRQIFQTIIERNRARRRPKKNIHKFRELEELGLGEVKNNRWYPSDSKTFSIWHGMHQSVQGIQAEFKKYPKTYLKRLD